MALAKCPDCSHDVSSIALACPHCGRPMKSAPAGERQVREVQVGVVARGVAWLNGLPNPYRNVAEVDAAIASALRVLEADGWKPLGPTNYDSLRTRGLVRWHKVPNTLMAKLTLAGGDDVMIASVHIDMERRN